MELAVQVNGSYAHVRSIAEVAESAGFAAVALADHYLNGSGPSDYSKPVFDSLSQAAALVRDTTSIEVATLVSPVTFRHPAVYAKSMSTIDDISGGRFALGVGAGWHDDEHRYFGIPFPSTPERFALLEDALGYLHTYMRTPGLGYEGEYFRLQPFEVQPSVRPSARLIVGGTGPHVTPRLAGTFGGEFNLAVHDPRVVADRVAKMRRSAADHGRDPDSIKVSTAYRMIGGADTDEIDAFLAEWGVARGQSVAEMRQFVGGRIPMLTWDDHVERLRALEDLGFQRIYVKVVSKSRRAFAEAATHLAPLLPSANRSSKGSSCRTS